MTVVDSPDTPQPKSPLSRPIRMIISGGGTGGHIFPAVAIANAVRRRDPRSRILFVGAEGRMEMERVPAAGYDIVGLPVMGFDRKRVWRNFKVLYKLAKSMLKARKVVREFEPDIAVGVGGYASGPLLKEAQKRGIPTLLQEQNSYAGVTNKMLAPKAKAICVAYDGMERFFPATAIRLTGNPLREAVVSYDPTITPQEARKRLGFDPDRPLVAVVGGSLGARTINESVIQSIDPILDAGAQILWQTGRIYADQCRQVADRYIGRGVIATPFLDDMGLVYRAADIVVSRAGASTISEIQALGMPSVLIPSPNVAEDHQRHNARALERCGAAVMILDADARRCLAGEVTSLLSDPTRRKSMSEAARAMAHLSSDERIVDEIFRIVADNASSNAKK